MLEQAAKPAGQCETVAHSLQTLLTQMGAAAEVHVSQAYVPPQPFGTEPQFFPAQAVTFGVLVQPHTLSLPPPPQVCGDVHDAQVC